MTDNKLIRGLFSPRSDADEATLLKVAQIEQRSVTHGNRKRQDSRAPTGPGRSSAFAPIGQPGQPRPLNVAIPWGYKRLRDGIVVPADHDLAVDQRGQQVWSSTQDNRLFWVGHATFVLRRPDLMVITDPVLTSRLGVFRRLTPPGLSLDRIDRPVVVVISHNHRDHLDLPSLRILVQASRGNIRFLVPLGMGSWFRRVRLSNVTEFDWWEHVRLRDDLDLTFVPAKHWSMRMPWDKNRSLWGGWWIRSAGQTLHYCGDTAFTTFFEQLHDRLGPSDHALLPIGAYEPRELLHHHHVDPEEAFEIFRMLQADRFIPFHWGAFVLADEPVDEPPQRLQHAFEQDHDVDNTRLQLLEPGGSVSLEQ